MLRWRIGSCIGSLAIVACGGSTTPDEASRPARPATSAAPSAPPNPSGCCTAYETITPAPPPSPYPACSPTTTGPCALLDRIVNTGTQMTEHPRLGALDATSAYWADSTHLSRIPKNGSTSVTESVATSAFFGALAVDASAIYWTDAASLERLAKAGGSPQKLADTPNAAVPAVLAIDATDAYITLAPPLASPIAASHVLRVPLSGGAASTAFDTDTPCLSLALDDTSIYCTTGMRISRFPKAGGAPTVLFDTSPSTPLTGMVLADATLYAAQYQSTKLTRLSVDGTLLAPLDVGVTLFDPKLVVQDGAAYVSVSTKTEGEIRRLPLDGSALSKLPTNGFALVRLTADVTGLYWVDTRQTCLHSTTYVPTGKGSGGGYVCHEYLSEIRAMRAPLAL